MFKKIFLKVCKGGFPGLALGFCNGLLESCCEKGRVGIPEICGNVIIVGDFNYLNGYWRTQPISNHRRCFHVVADSLHQAANVSIRRVTVFCFLWGCFGIFRISQ